jgi:hypothetical protein
VVVSDSLGLFIKEELLLSLVVSPSLEDNVVGSNALSHSVEWKLRDKIEWSVDVESKLFIQSLGLSLCFLVKIENLPSLVGSIVSWVDLNFLSLVIFTLENIKASIGFLDVAEMFSLVDEDLEPSRVGAPDLHLLGLSGTLDVP